MTNFTLKNAEIVGVQKDDDGRLSIILSTFCTEGQICECSNLNVTIESNEEQTDDCGNDVPATPIQCWEPKAGDRFFIFLHEAGDKIYECIVADVDNLTIAYQIVGEPRERPYIAFRMECFPTREALCEHYRKIFE